MENPKNKLSDQEKRQIANFLKSLVAGRHGSGHYLVDAEQLNNIIASLEGKEKVEKGEFPFEKTKISDAIRGIFRK